jgi:acyl carrier protein/GNAT superfamily N-acetyltransferase
MNKNEVEREIIQIIRQKILSGSDREINLQDPIGELGLGLDSLALVEFITAIENRYQIELSDKIWTDREQLTLQYFIDLIIESNSADSPIIKTSSPLSSQSNLIAMSRYAKFKQVIHEGGWLKGIIWASSRFIGNILEIFYEYETRYILSFNLLENKLPSYSSSLKIDLSVATLSDSTALNEFLTSYSFRTADNKKMTIDIFRQRMDSGYTGLVAWYQSKIIGIDWLSNVGYNCPFTGLKIMWPKEFCYAMELYEHKKYQGQGVGLALLAFSLVEAKKKGYSTQITLVRAKNIKMLSAAIHFFSFRKIGEVHTIRIFRRPFSKWQIGKNSGRGGILLLQEVTNAIIPLLTLLPDLFRKIVNICISTSDGLADVIANTSFNCFGLAEQFLNVNIIDLYQNLAIISFACDFFRFN